MIGQEPKLSSTVHTLFSPAKINIGLSIVGRRADGKHELQSLFWPLSWGDDIELRRSKRLTVSTVWAEEPSSPTLLPSQESNLVYRALTGLPDKNRNWEITIRKKIPIGAGFGGGSS